MQRRTTTLQIQKAMKSNFLCLIKAEVYNKSTRKTEEIPNEKFLDCFDYFCESEFFMDSIGWYFEYDIKAKQYIIETGRMNGDVDFIFIAHLCACDDSNVEDIEKTLLFLEE